MAPWPTDSNLQQQKLLVIFSLFLACALSLPFTVKAAARTVTVGVYEDFPMVFVEHGQPKGLYIDLLNEIAKHEGWRLQFVAGTWPEVYRKTLKGEIDILTSIAHAEKRRPYFDFTTIPVEIGYGRLAVRKHSELNSLAELDNIRIGLMRDDINGLELKKKTKELGVAPIWVYYDNYTEMLRALSKGEIEVAAINNLYSRYELDTFGLKYAAPFYAPVMLTFAAAKGKHRDLLNTIDKYMARWKEDPDSIYYSVREKWLRAHLRPWLPVWVKPVVTILATVFLLSVLWVFTLRRKIRQRTEELVATQQQLQQSINALSELQARLKAIIHALPDGLVTFNTDGHITGCYGNMPNGLPTPRLGTHLVEAFAPDLSAMLLNEAEAALKADSCRTFTTKLQTGETPCHYEFRLCRFEPATDSFALLMMVRDISALEVLRDSAQSINARFAAFAEAMPDLGFILTRTGDYVSVFGGRTDLFVRPPDELTGKNIQDVLPKSICTRLLQSIEQAITTNLTACVEYSLEVPAGLRHFEAQIAPIQGQNIVDEVAMISRDITHRIEAEEAIRQLAFYDTVTELPNRKLFMDRLKQAISQTRRGAPAISVLMLDLDGFKAVNDTVGHDAGDELLKIIGQRLQEVIRASDTVARYGGDEFVILQTMVHSPEDAAVFCEKIIRTISAPVRIQGRDTSVAASIGIAFYDESHSEISPEELLRQADLAMYAAKENGKNGFCFYDENLSAISTHQVNLIQNLRQAIEHRELTLFFQPQVDLASGKITSLEALVRWEIDGEAISPSHVIPLAEETGLIFDLDRLIAEHAIHQLKLWQEMLPHPPIVAFNVSAKEFQNNSFVDFLLALIKKHNVDPHLLELEITESIFLANIEAAAESIGLLHTAGVRISIDDFGTGYSSFQYLKRLPIEKLKIDIDFVRGLAYSVHDKEIVHSILELSASLDFVTVAEGIETEEQHKILLEMGCQLGQGYLFATPAPANEVTSWLTQGKIRFPRFTS